MSDLAQQISDMLTKESEYNFNGITVSDEYILNLVRHLSAHSAAFKELLNVASQVGSVTIHHGGMKGCRCGSCTEFTVTCQTTKYVDGKWVENEVEINRNEFYEERECRELEKACEKVIADDKA